MVVDDAAGLVFGDFGIGDGQVVGELVAPEPAGLGEVAAQVDGETRPESAGGGVEQDVAGVVVGVGVQGCPDERVVDAVPSAAVRSLACSAGVAGA